jgi:nucleoside-diphosphate-sugar epimerase
MIKVEYKTSKMKKILITGSLGYIGSVVYEHLTNSGYLVKGIDNGIFDSCLLENSSQQNVVYKNATDITEHDIADQDVVIHLSGLQNDPIADTYPGKLYDVEYEYSLSIAKVCKRIGIKFIYASSCSVYGYSNSDNYLSECDLTNPLTPYSINKLRTEKAIIDLSNDKFTPVLLRFATLFGYSPRIRFDLYINMFVGMALTSGRLFLNSDGSSWRPNVHINDISKVLQLVIEKEFDACEVINVGNNNLNCQVKDVIEILKKQIPDLSVEFAGSKHELFNDQYVVGGKDKRSYKVDFSKLNNIFGDIVCKTTLEDGISDMINRFRSMDNFSTLFIDSKFYRLQWMKNLMNEGMLDDKLNFNGIESIKKK